MSVRLGPYLNAVPEENKITLLQVIQNFSLVQDILRTIWLVCTYGYHGQKLKFYSPKHFCKFEWNFTHFALSRNLLENFHISDLRSVTDFSLISRIIRIAPYVRKWRHCEQSRTLTLCTSKGSVRNFSACRDTTVSSIRTENFQIFET